MASASYSKRLLINRNALSSLKSSFQSKKKIPTPTPFSSPLPTSSVSYRRFSSLSRSPAALGCVQSLIPLHSAVAAARLTSCLSSSSPGSRALSQELGLSGPR